MTAYSFNALNLKTINVFRSKKIFPSIYNIIAFIFIMTILALITLGTHGMDRTLVTLQTTPIELSLSNLPKYALFSTLRMFAAIVVSLIFTFIVATIAAKSRRAETLIIPTLDVLQSIPILGFLTFTVAIFMGLFPGSQLGVELGAIFVIFTSQAWNIAFSFYHSLENVPQDLKDICDQFGLSGWQKFWQLEVPFAIPGLVWNIMISMSGGWFFVVASEAIVVGNTKIALPGIGSWLALAIDHKDLVSVGWAVLAMAIIIFVSDQFIFRPIVAWSQKFRMGEVAREQEYKSWFYDVIRQSDVLSVLKKPFSCLKEAILRLRWFPNTHKITIPSLTPRANQVFDILWWILLATLVSGCVLFLGLYLYPFINLKTVLHIFMLGGFTAIRVIILIILVSLIWVPIGVWVGLRPRLTAFIQPLAQFLAAFPANILFPVFVIFIVKYKLNPDIWLSPLMVLGSQWYIFFNVIAGASVFPEDLKETCIIYNIRSWLWWRQIILPSIFPYYITGALTASGGAWNASIVAEIIHWGSITLSAHGLGTFIALSTEKGDTHSVVLGVAVMCVFVIAFNRLIWHKLYAYTSQYMRLD